ncbi:ras GTPase-activating protein 1 [Lingula anatina]|uniref:Ras GTPase-activating protein 1 n=1 Tax=Lingula anatina TaxID=7574 RepID=A0A2R2MST3_LINAN|nr:ras GTPase-activating protein 1 [Lingula anatina]|eukprot:XP_023933304.1 ras GTPase-activating protein 1 [Lingula anatina]
MAEPPGDTSDPAELTEEFDPYSGEVERVDENLDVSLAAPPESQWYHGRLDRQTAEDRLRTKGENGSYLIRESERKHGQYVLSFLGETGINHFRITAMCGDYYIGGRQFDSLSDLIGYYTKVSDLLKGERLKMPIPPPEPVDDKRRVIAILPYNKIPDTDELSFEKGDVFLVHNELGDGWIWVTSLRTKESGIVYQELVEDLNGSVDLVENNLWFHPSITKQEVSQKLGQAGPGSFLVRPSEMSPGDFTLYFYVENQIQKFKISRKGSQFALGGRYFESIRAIIGRYKKEQIVEGHTLGDPVLRNATEGDECIHELDTDETDARTRQIYATIRQMQSSGSNFLINRNDHIVLKGFLNKKSERGNKWKNMHFVLNGTEHQLYFFENDKRSKPKGLIDLSYSSLYPVHDSLFGRPSCFQLVVRALNHFSVHYLCAENADTAQEWVQALKPYCINTTPAKSSLRQLLSLNIHVLDAHRLPVKSVPHPYCTVSINEVKVCRTEAKEAPNPVWEDEFVLEDIPQDIYSFTVIVHNKGRRSKDTEVLFKTVLLNELNQGEYQEEWYCLSPTAVQAVKGRNEEMGSIRVKCKFLHEIIMPINEYSSLKELLLAKDLEAVKALTQVCGNDRIPLAKSLLNIFRKEKQESHLIRTMNDREIDKECTVSNLFRATSFATTLMDQYMKMVATDFVHHAAKSSVMKIIESRQSCELNPTLLDNPTDATANKEHLLSVLKDVVRNIFMSTDKCPLVLRYICGCLQKKVISKWPEDETVKTRVVSGFIFLRLLCPALLNPKCFNIITETPSEVAARSLKLVAKSLQNLANLVEFGAKEPFMEVVNPFILGNKQRMVMFLDELSNIPEYPVVGDYQVADIGRDLANVHQICTSHAQELQALDQAQAAQGDQRNQKKQHSLKRLVTVTDMLTKHKQHYLGNL